MNSVSEKVCVPLLDVWVTPVTASGVVSLVAERPDRPRLILNHNLHSAYLYRENSWFRDLYAQSDYTVIDGWPVYVLAARSRKLSNECRIGSTDWISALWATPGLAPMRVFILGGSDQVNADAVASWQRSRPTDVVAGRSGYLSVEDEPGVVDLIRRHDPQLVLVGMGMPLQEAFLARNLARMPNAYVATVGGAVDYVAGAVKLSPRWLGRCGLEWAWRFLHDPSRLYGRYFVEPRKLAAVLIRDWLRTRGLR